MEAGGRLTLLVQKVGRWRRRVTNCPDEAKICPPACCTLGIEKPLPGGSFLWQKGLGALGLSKEQRYLQLPEASGGDLVSPGSFAGRLGLGGMVKVPLPVLPSVLLGLERAIFGNPPAWINLLGMLQATREWLICLTKPARDRAWLELVPICEQPLAEITILIAICARASECLECA